MAERRRFREAYSAGDGGAAIATNLVEELRVLLLMHRHLHQRAQAIEKRRAGTHVGKGVLQRLPAHARPIGPGGVALALDIVRAQDHEHPGRVATASRVFHEQRVIQIALQIARQSDVLRQ